MSMNPKIVDVVRQLDSQFWDTFQKKAAEFPDTEEGDDARHLAVTAAITSIAGNYILGFLPGYRAHHLETLVQHLRNFEIQFRDYKLPE